MNNNDFYSEYNQQEDSYRTAELQETNVALAKAYLWMFLGTFISFIIGLLSSKFLLKSISEGDERLFYFYLGSFFVTFIIQSILCFKINKEALVKMNFGKALTLFLIYAILEGTMFAFLFSVINVQILFYAFGAVSAYFLLLSAISFIFRKKINKLSGFAVAGLISFFIVSLVSIILTLIFYNNPELTRGIYLTILIFGLLVFSVLTVVDVKKMHELIGFSQDKNAASISAAFNLYLDFINMFIFLLRIILIVTSNRRN